MGCLSWLSVLFVHISPVIASPIIAPKNSPNEIIESVFVINTSRLSSGLYFENQNEKVHSKLCPKLLVTSGPK